mmetsp:Transcript_42052/g.133619  ORF Transcript_42052/g.133619 Transcript_42052/m.133619 type:complete len:347 (-) Transcript_42052:579-1619(-)
MLVKHDVDVQALGLALQPQAAVAELRHVDDARAVLVQQAEQQPRVLRADVQGLQIVLEVFVLEEVLHLVDADLPRAILVNGVEDLLHVRRRDLLGLQAVLDDEVLVVLRAGHGTLHKHGGQYVHHAERDQRDVGQEEGTEGPVHLQQRVQHQAPALAVADGHVEAVEGAGQAAIAASQLRDGQWLVLLWITDRPQVLGHTLGEEDREGVHHEEQQDQGPKEGLDGGLQGVDHLPELADVLQHPGHPQGADHAHEADRTEDAAQAQRRARAGLHEHGDHEVDEGRHDDDDFEVVPAPVRAEEEGEARGAQAQHELDEEARVQDHLCEEEGPGGPAFVVRHPLRLNAD